MEAMTSALSKRPSQVKHGSGRSTEGRTAAFKVRNDVGKSKTLVAEVVRNRKTWDLFSELQ